MSNKKSQDLPTATKKRIRTDASTWNKNQYDNDDVNDDYLEGALHEAKLAQAAEEKAQRYEKALKELKLYILNCLKYLTDPSGVTMLPRIDEALTPKTTTDGTE